eukprot:3616395-Pyramimonas_sp.AAC.1
MMKLDTSFNWASTCYVIRDELRPLPMVDPAIAVCVRARLCPHGGYSFWPPPPRRRKGNRKKDGDLGDGGGAGPKEEDDDDDPLGAAAAALDDKSDGDSHGDAESEHEKMELALEALAAVDAHHRRAADEG